MVNFLQESI